MVRVMASVRASEAEAAAWLCERLLNCAAEERDAVVEEFLLRVLDMHAEAVEQEKDIGEAFERALKRAQDLALEVYPRLGFEWVWLTLKWSGLDFALVKKPLLAHRFRAKALRRLAELGACHEKATEREQGAERAVPAERGEAGVAELPAEGEAAEVERRLRLLREYMEATGCSEYQIYETATKLKLHSCYKPQFREWKNGKLPADSVTAQSLERFLAEKKPPSAKKSKSSPR